MSHFSERTWYRVVNFAAFQAGWFACVLGASHGVPVVGVLVVAVWLLCHVLALPGVRRRSEALLLAGSGALGWGADTALVATGMLSFRPTTGSSPLWMVCLWVNLAATLNFALRWMAGRYVLACLAGAIAGPLAYVAGERLGAPLELQGGSPGMVGVAVEWAICMPVLLWLARPRPESRP